MASRKNTDGQELRQTGGAVDTQRNCALPEKTLSGKRVLPGQLTGGLKLADVVDSVFLAYNAGRLREACRLFVDEMLGQDVTVGMSLAGALTPAGLGPSCVVPLIKAGFVDWITTTGANLYHDLHFALNFPLHLGGLEADDRVLRAIEVVRVYDVLISQRECLTVTDEKLSCVLTRPEFQKQMGTAEFNYLLGRYAAEWERDTGAGDVSVLAAAYRAGVPCYTPSPGDSGIGMTVAELQLGGNGLSINPSLDVNDTTALVLAAKRAGGKTGIVLWGGGSPKNFMLQTGPQLRDVLRLDHCGQDFFIQVTDARPDTGGLSGATPSEALSWGKLDASRSSDAVVCYTDTTIALPILTEYALSRRKPRPLKRLYDRREQILQAFVEEWVSAHTQRGG